MTKMHPPLEITVSCESASPSVSSFRKPISSKLALASKTALVGPSTLSAYGNQKSVSFSKRVKIKKIRAHTLYSEAERTAQWHTEEEYAAIKQGCIRTLKLMMRGELVENDEFCPRGLEVRTRSASAARKEVRALAASQVFEEQDIQNDLRVRSEERIRQAYLEVSCDALSRAQFYGLKDEKAAKDYLSRR